MPKKREYYGISLVEYGHCFWEVESPCEVPIVAWQGQLNLLYEKGKALLQRGKNFVSIIEPLNFVKPHCPRPIP